MEIILAELLQLSIERPNFLDNSKFFEFFVRTKNGHKLANFQNIEPYFFLQTSIFFIVEKDFGLKNRDYRRSCGVIFRRL